ncbi:ComEA family DNA-binding protein [Secundilactobacillus collinoides]|nr:helix-hairpin-helix domain-containing protein [Secundilactobacillus collinoides]
MLAKRKHKKIIDYRSAKGQFQSIEDIKNVSGFGDKTFERLKPQLAV